MTRVAPVTGTEAWWARINYPLILICLFALVWATLPLLAAQSETLRILITKETGPIERASPFLLGISALLFFFAPYDLPNRKWMLGTVCLLFLVREFDINKEIARNGFAFFPHDFKGNFPVGYAIVETVAVISIVALILYMAWSYRRVVRENLRRRDRHQIMLLMVWVCVGLSILSDGASNKILDLFGERPPLWLKSAIEGFEEGTEFLIPFCIILGLLEYYRTRIWTKQAPRYNVSP